MATINTLVNAGKYYNLTDSSDKKASEGTGLSALLDTGNNGQTATKDKVAPASYLLDLSPEAQNYLSNYKPQQSTAAAGFHLTAKQQAVMDSILAQYKDAPYNDDTFARIQDDLDKAGLSPDKLALENNLRNFSATSILVAALNGQEVSANVTPETIADGQKANVSSYMQSIANQWKKISTTADAASDSAETDV